MTCQRMGLPPISTIGFGRMVVSSDSRVPNPPAKMIAFIRFLSFFRKCVLLVAVINPTTKLINTAMLDYPSGWGQADKFAPVSG